MFQCRLVQSMGSLYQSHTTGSVIIARWLRWPLFPIGMRIILSKIGNTEAALEAYQKSLAITEQLVALDPQNAEFQHDPSISYIKLGDIQRNLGNTDAALEAYQQSLTIRERLLAQDRQNVEYKLD